MIHNPLNKGTVVMNRLHYDFESKRTMKVPAEEHYVHEDKVPPIVSKELWEIANQEIVLIWFIYVFTNLAQQLI